MSFFDQKLLETILSGIAVAVAFPVGALIAMYVPYNAAKRALFAAFGAGIFFAAVMVLVQQALEKGNVFDLVIGFALGAATFGVAEHYIRHRNVDGEEDDDRRKKRLDESEGKLTIVGTILDSVPESIFIGILSALREPGLLSAVIVIFLGNLATTLEGAKLMHNQGLNKARIFRDWFIDFLIVAFAAPLGYIIGGLTPNVVALVLSFATGALMVFIAGELIARAYRESKGHNEDLAISAGFLIGVILLFVV